MRIDIDPDPNTFTPRLVPGRNRYALVLVETEACGCCGVAMLPKLLHSFDSTFFPRYYTLSQDAQMQRAGWKYRTKVKNKDDQNICVDCEKAGKADFKCAACEQVQPTSEIKERFGDPAEYLCKGCYSTLTAQEWEKHTSRLHDIHRYDFE